MFHCFVVSLSFGWFFCQVLEKEAFDKQMLEKLIWICAFMLVGARHGTNVGGVEKEYRSEVLFLELQVLEVCLFLCRIWSI